MLIKTAHVPRWARALVLFIPAIWVGLIIGISFIEAPLKFQAPDITIPLGLGIGRLVFGALNIVEAITLIALGAWGRRFLPTTPELAIRLQILEDGGSDLQEAFMAELRERHLGNPDANRGSPVSDRLQAAYAESVAQASHQDS